MENTNEMKIIFDSRPENEGAGKSCGGSFLHTAESYSGGSGRSEKLLCQRL